VTKKINALDLVSLLADRVNNKANLHITRDELLELADEAIEEDEDDDAGVLS
jgi:hypothetical protein